MICESLRNHRYLKLVKISNNCFIIYPFVHVVHSYAYVASTIKENNQRKKHNLIWHNSYKFNFRCQKLGFAQSLSASFFLIKRTICFLIIRQSKLSVKWRMIFFIQASWRIIFKIRQFNINKLCALVICSWSLFVFSYLHVNWPNKIDYKVSDKTR